MSSSLSPSLRAHSFPSLGTPRQRERGESERQLHTITSSSSSSSLPPPLLFCLKSVRPKKSCISLSSERERERERVTSPPKRGGFQQKGRRGSKKKIDLRASLTSSERERDREGRTGLPRRLLSTHGEEEKRERPLGQAEADKEKPLQKQGQGRERERERGEKKPPTPTKRPT